MEAKVLVALDLSEDSLRAVDFVGTMIGRPERLKVTLLHIIREPSSDIVPDERKRSRYLEERGRETSDLMEEAIQRLASWGVPESSITLKTPLCGKTMTVADFILRELAEGGYNALVMGRRELSKQEEFLYGSVSGRVLREAKRCALCIVS